MNVVLIATPEQAAVIAFTCAELPGLKVQASPNDQKDMKSRWTAFASGDGAALPYFAGKTYAGRAQVEKAVAKFYGDMIDRRTAK